MERFVEPEQRLASHILLALDKDADEAKVAEVRMRAEELTAKARAAGALPAWSVAWTLESGA